MIPFSLRFSSSVLVGLFALVFGGATLFAWTGPSATPPSSNVSAPVNVGSTDQVKNAGLSVNALAVFGNSAITGNVTAAGFFHSSDARLKEQIQTLSGLDIVSRLRGVSFVWKKDSTPSAGVIAQEVETVMPSAVRETPDGTKVVEYDQIIGALIEAVKEQQAEIESLKHEIELLKADQ